MSRTKGSIRSQMISRSSLVVRVESLETRVPVSEGIGPFLTISALTALGELAQSSALAPPHQVVHFDNLTSTHSHPDSIYAPVEPEPASPRPAADLPWIAQPVADVPATSFAADEGDLFQAFPGAPFAAGRPAGQARPSWEGQEPVALGLDSSAPPERAPAFTWSNATDGVARNDRADAELLQSVVALRVDSQGNQGPGTTDLDDLLPVDMTYTPVFPKPERALAGQPFTYQFTAAVPTDHVPLTPCLLLTPTWQWTVSAGYSSSLADPLGNPPPGSWSHSISSPTSSATAVTFTSQVEGHWEFGVQADVEYQDSCANVWVGGASVTLVESTFAAQAPPFKMESHPNSDVAIRNDWVEQIGTTEVLKGWRVRYTAPGEGVTQWQYRYFGFPTWYWFRDAQQQIFQGNPVYFHEQQEGDFEVRYARGAQFDQYSATRRIKVTEPNLVQFIVTPGGQYTKNGYHVIPPPTMMNPAVTFRGVVSQTPTSPPIYDKIRWGFVQSVEFLTNVTLNWVGLTWQPGTPDGTTVEFPSRLSTQSTPTRKNDNRVGQQFYPFGGPVPLSLNAHTTDDTPSAPNGDTRHFKNKPLNQDVPVNYDRNQHSAEQWGFVTWVVVVNRETQQYTPLRQIPWTLQIDTTQTGPWTAVVGAGADPTRPVAATESVNPYRPLVPGPLVPVTAPRTTP